MGLMNTPGGDGRLIVTPHPVLVDGQKNVTADLRPGESLYRFLMRHVEDLDGNRWEVTIGGRSVPRHLWHHVYPKHGQLIELRGGVGKAAIAIVAMVALTYFTFGIGTAASAGMWGAGAVAGSYGALAATAVYMAGAVLINQVLAPKQPKASAAAPTSYSISAGRNRARPYEPLGLLLGSVRIALDLISQPYTHYEGDDQFLSLALTPGINVDSVGELYNGDAPLSSYEGVQVWHNGFPAMASVELPLYSNADVVDGGTLLDTSNDPKGRPGAWVQRSSSPGAVRLMVGIEFQLFDKTSRGKDKLNQEQIEIHYRAAGTQAWQVYGNYRVTGSTAKTQRVSYTLDVAEGQYEVRVRAAGRNTDGSGAQASFTWTTLTTVQRDTGDYSGIPRIGVRMKATGQLNGAPDELRCVAYSRPIPVWKGTGWVTERTSNPGAQILAYARGIYAPNGKLLAGMGLPDRQIDIEGLKAFMLHCAANEFAYDHWITDVRSHQQVLDMVALAGFGQVSWPRGRLSVAWAADEQPLSGVVNMATIKKGQFQVDYMLANAADGIEYTYLDRTTWEAKTLRVPAQGIEVMLNPAQVTGEGVTTEAHAAMLARWHLAQTLYQYKSIGYSTDIEHLSYSRMSMLALQHDMTQWGYGGRIMGAAVVGGRMVLDLDEPVPAPPQGNAFVGLRIPGERVYRVMRVQPFTGTARSLTLVDPWPADAAVPGNSEANPAWDTLWIYDFKQTPGLRVRVTSIRPESDLKGAAVEVVAESPEFWQYVKTGKYVPSPNDSLLQTRPVASDLKITERQVVQGDTEFTELQATYAVTGPVGDVKVLSDLDGNSELEEVARTTTRTASWRIPGAGVYPITVRPYSPEGAAGIAASVIYTTRGADAPPVLVDLFDVEELSGGVRRYTWGFFSDTIQSANFAGVEIRYAPGKVDAPVWEQMTPLGDDGYHAAAFEAVLPPAGDWTFSCRSRNTAGALSASARVAHKTLGANLGEVIDDIGESLDEQTARLVEQQRQIDQEKLDRLNADLAESRDRAAAIAQVNANLAQETAFRVEAVKQVADNLTTTTNALAQEKIDRANAVLNEKLEREAAVENLATTTQTQFESVAQQIGSVAAGSGTQFDSAKIWLFNTAVEGWTSNGTPTVVDGMLRPANSTGAYAQSPIGLGIDGNAYRFIKTRVKRVGNAPWNGIVRWITDADQNWNDAKRLTIPEPSFDANGIATVDISDIPWNGSSPIRAIRMGLVTTQTATAYLMYDYVAIGRPSPGASTALVQEVQTALQQADQVIASSVTTLGVQMRGQYTGTDPAQLTSGLMYQEMTARVDADKAQVQRIFAMESRMPLGSGQLASAASVTALQEATTTTTNALAQSITTINATLPAMVAQGSNMVLNGGWDQGDNVGWTYTSMAGVAIVAEGRSGKCLKITAPNGARSAVANGAADRNMPVVVGKKYRVSAYYKTDAAYNGTADNGKVRIANQDDGLIAGLGFAANKTDWTRLETVVNATSISAIRVYVNSNHTAGTLWVDDVVVEEVTDVLANADGLQALTTTVTNQAGQITAQGNLISALRTDVDGKASNSALQSLQSQVTLQGNDITSLGTAITNVNASLGNIGGDNLLPNSSFETSNADNSTLPDWFASNTITQVVSYGAAYAVSGSSRAIQLSASAAATAVGQYIGVEVATANRPKPVPGTKYTLSAWVSRMTATAGRVQLLVQWLDANNAGIGSAQYAPISDLTSAMVRYTGTFTAPTGAVSVRIFVRVAAGAVGDNLAAAIDNVMFQQGEVATNWMPSGVEAAAKITANANATTALTGTVTSLQGTVTALGQSVTTVNAWIDNIGGDNLLTDSSFEESNSTTTVLPNWQTNSTSGLTTAFSYANSSLPGSSRALVISATFADANQYAGVEPVTALRPKVIVGQKYVQSAWAFGTVGARLRCIVQYVNAAGSNMGTFQQDFTITDTVRRYVTDATTAPAGSLFARVIWRIVPAAGGSGAHTLNLDNAQFQQGEVATNWMPSNAEILAKTNANAAATSTLQGSVTSLQGTVTAQGGAITTVTANLEQSNRSGNNMIIDGSFEAQPEGKAFGSYAVVVANGRTGVRSLRMRLDGGGTRSAPIQTFDITPGRTYYAEVWVTRSGANDTAGSMQLRMAQSLNNTNLSYPNFATMSAANIPFGSYVKVSGYLTVPEGKNQCVLQVAVVSSANNGANIEFDDIVLQDVTEAYNAQQTASGAASGVSSLQATVTQQGQQITAQASRIDGVQASVGGKADASVVQEMRVQVSNQGGGGNLIPNSSFPNWDRTGWGWDWNPSGWKELGDPLPGGGSVPFIPYGVKSATGSRRDGYYNVDMADNVAMQGHYFPLDVEKTYCVSAYLNTHRCRAQLLLECIDFQGKITGYLGTSILTPTGQANASLAQYPRPFVIGNVPQGTVRGRLILQLRGNNESDPYFWLVYPMVCEVAAGATKPPPYAPGDQASAQWNLAVQANGISAGMQLGITGQTSALNILANAVNILTPGGADGFEMTQGYLRVWSGNSQRIIGNGFGGDGLVDYFGPNVGAANANKTNATMWMDRNGNAYWGGAIAAGILRNAAQSTTTQTIGTSVLVGPFDTNGRNKQVVVGFSRQHRRTKNAMGNQGFVAGAGSNGGVINLYRQVDGQGEALWQQIPISGSVDITNETDGPDTAISSWSASVTLNDNIDGTKRRSYRAEVVSFSEQTVNHQSGSFDGQTIVQSLSIISIEQQ